MLMPCLRGLSAQSPHGFFKIYWCRGDLDCLHPAGPTCVLPMRALSAISMSVAAGRRLAALGIDGRRPRDCRRLLQLSLDPAMSIGSGARLSINSTARTEWPNVPYLQLNATARRESCTWHSVADARPPRGGLDTSSRRQKGDRCPVADGGSKALLRFCKPRPSPAHRLRTSKFNGERGRLTPRLFGFVRPQGLVKVTPVGWR